MTEVRVVDVEGFHYGFEPLFRHDFVDFCLQTGVHLADCMLRAADLRLTVLNLLTVGQFLEVLVLDGLLTGQERPVSV